MSVKTFLTVISLIGLLFGIGELLVPDKVAAIYGVQTSPGAAMMSRFFGVALLAWAMISWFARDFHDESDLRHVLAPSALASSAGVVVAAMATMAGTMNALGWFPVLIFLFGALGSLYFLTARLPQGLVHH